MLAALLLSTVQERTDPTPLTAPSTWLSQADYPKVLSHIQGRTVVTLQVDEGGRVTACKVRLSSGSATLDTTVCNRAYQFARFAPARDEQGTAVPSEYIVPVLWGKPAIDIQPGQERTVTYLENGRAKSCQWFDGRGNPEGPALTKCSFAQDLLIKHFRESYMKADKLTVDFGTVPGDGVVIRELPDGQRVILKESAVTIDNNGQVKSCSSRIHAAIDGSKLTLASCVGYPIDRPFTGLRSFVSYIDWTLHYPSGNTAMQSKRK